MVLVCASFCGRGQGVVEGYLLIDGGNGKKSTPDQSQMNEYE